MCVLCVCVHLYCVHMCVCGVSVYACVCGGCLCMPVCVCVNYVCKIAHIQHSQHCTYSAEVSGTTKRQGGLLSWLEGPQKLACTPEIDCVMNVD